MVDELDVLGGDGGLLGEVRLEGAEGVGSGRGGQGDAKPEGKGREEGALEGKEALGCISELTHLSLPQMTSMSLMPSEDSSCPLSSSKALLSLSHCCENQDMPGGGRWPSGESQKVR